MPSKDEPKVRNAIKAITAMDKIEDVTSYIEGDERQDVLDAAQVQIEFIKNQGAGSSGQGSGPPEEPSTRPPSPQSSPTEGEEVKKKQGETGPITKKTSEFKKGLEGTKGAASSDSATISISDLAPAIDEASDKKLAEARQKEVEDASKRAKGEAVPKGHTTCEDVIQKLRAGGRDI